MLCPECEICAPASGGWRVPAARFLPRSVVQSVLPVSPSFRAAFVSGAFRGATSSQVVFTLSEAGVVPCYPHRKSGGVTALRHLLGGAGVPPPHLHCLSKDRAEGRGGRGERAQTEEGSPNESSPFKGRGICCASPFRDLLTHSHASSYSPDQRAQFSSDIRWFIHSFDSFAL